MAVYDTLYLALGLREGCQVVTADRPFYDALAAAFPGTMLRVGDLPAAQPFATRHLRSGRIITFHE